MKYRTIVADPPWDYSLKAWASITHGGIGPRIEKPMPYATMSGEAIAALRVAASFCDTDCRLFLWATSRHLPVAFAVMAGWGFGYAQTLVWHKTGNPSPFSGSGVAPQHAEFLLVGKRGNPEILGRLPSSVIAAPKPIFGHSQKPDVFMDLIEQVSPSPRLEMFARRQRLGWDTWGDEALSHTEITS